MSANNGVLVDCHFCKCPVIFDSTGRLAALGITLDVLDRHDLAVICQLCTDMAETEDNDCFEVIDEKQLKARLDKEVA